MRKSAYIPNKPSTKMQKGVKAAIQSWQVCQYFFFLSDSADHRTSGGVWEWCERASVSIIWI